MQRGLPVRLTYSSRVVLYHLKKFLTLRKITLESYLTTLFSYIKVQYKKQQFIHIFHSADKKIHPFYIAQLFQELNLRKNETVQFEFLKQAVLKVDHRDNPEQEYNDAEEYKKVSQKELLEIYKDIIILLGESKQSLFRLQNFLTSNGGQLTKQNFSTIFKEVNFQDHFKKTIFLQSCFEQHSQITIDFLLSKFDKLEQKYQEEQLQKQKKISPVNKSGFKIKPIKQKYNWKKSIDCSQMAMYNRYYKWTESQLKYVRGQILFEEEDCISLNQIPQDIRSYFNEQSYIEPLFATIAVNHLIKNLDFADKANPTNSKALTKFHITSKFRNVYYLFNQHEQFILRYKKYDYLKQLINPKDIVQGNSQSCYFLTGIVGFVEKHPEFIYKLFVMKKNPAHLYGVRLFVQGKWKTLILDASFPQGRRATFCCAQPRNRQIWVMLLEKAWAKAYGSYDAIDGGQPGEGLTAISGAPSQLIPLVHQVVVLKVLIRIQEGAIVSCGSSPHLKSLSLYQQKKIGIIASHAYSLLDVYPCVSTLVGKICLVKLRNPWGNTQWQGDWHFSSSLWTQRLRKDFNYQRHPRDGSFFMSLQDFLTFFNSVSICPITSGNKNSYIEFENSNLEFQTVNVTIPKKGRYSFTIYQENPRKYGKNKYNEEPTHLSKSWIFLLKNTSKQHKAIKSNFISYVNNTLSIQLQPGSYTILTKIQWQKWQRHNFILSSYGPFNLIFQKVDQWNLKRLEQYIQDRFLYPSKEKQLEIMDDGSLQFSQHEIIQNIPQNNQEFFIINKSHINTKQGYGFFFIKNLENFPLYINIEYRNCNNAEKRTPNYSVLPPHQLPFDSIVFPQEQIFLKFLLNDPLEFELNLQLDIIPIFELE